MDKTFLLFSSLVHVAPFGDSKLQPDTLAWNPVMRRYNCQCRHSTSIQTHASSTLSSLGVSNPIRIEPVFTSYVIHVGYTV